MRRDSSVATMSSEGSGRLTHESRRKEKTVSKIVVSQFVTLDGVFEDPGGSENHEHGGWALQIERGPEGDKFKLDEVMESDALLLGRVTYEGFAEAWPSREGEFADKFNNMRKYVVSSTLGQPTWNNSTVIEHDVAGEVAKLREQDGGNILVNGSGQLIRTLMENDLVDEYRLMVFPVVLGSGKRLFADGIGKTQLRLAEARPVGPDGVVILTYRPAD
jgi:dihydrofolate reductase